MYVGVQPFEAAWASCMPFEAAYVSDRLYLSVEGVNFMVRACHRWRWASSSTRVKNAQAKVQQQDMGRFF